MNPHVHSHTLMSAGGLSLDGQRWITAPPGEFLPLDELARTFRDVLLHRLDALYRRGELVPRGKWGYLRWVSEWEDWLAHSRSSWKPRKDGRGVPLCAKTRPAEGERGTGGKRVPTSRRSRHAVRGEVPVATGAADSMGRRLPLRTACLERRLAGEPSRYESCSLAAIRVSAHSGTWNGAHRCMS